MKIVIFAAEAHLNLLLTYRTPQRGETVFWYYFLSGSEYTYKEQWAPSLKSLE